MSHDAGPLELVRAPGSSIAPLSASLVGQDVRNPYHIPSAMLAPPASLRIDLCPLKPGAQTDSSSCKLSVGVCPSDKKSNWPRKAGSKPACFLAKAEVRLSSMVIQKTGLTVHILTVAQDVTWDFQDKTLEPKFVALTLGLIVCVHCGITCHFFKERN